MLDSRKQWMKVILTVLFFTMLICCLKMIEICIPVQNNPDTWVLLLISSNIGKYYSMYSKSIQVNRNINLWKTNIFKDNLVSKMYMNVLNSRYLLQNMLIVTFKKCEMFNSWWYLTTIPVYNVGVSSLFPR